MIVIIIIASLALFIAMCVLEIEKIFNKKD